MTSDRPTLGICFQNWDGHYIICSFLFPKPLAMRKKPASMTTSSRRESIIETRVQLASQFLSALICGDPKRSIESRLPEVRHALLLADVLLAHAAQPDGSALHMDDLRKARMDQEFRPSAAIEPEAPRDHLFRHLPAPPSPIKPGNLGTGPTLH
jgi:hypothetical protein